MSLQGVTVTQKVDIPHPGEVLWGCRLFGGGCGVTTVDSSPPQRFSVSRSAVCGCRVGMREKKKLVKLKYKKHVKGTCGYRDEKKCCYLGQVSVSGGADGTCDRVPAFPNFNQNG